MNGNDYQRAALRTCNKISKSDKVLNGALGLCGETGEVADLIKKNKFQGHELDKKKLLEELGDICWYIAILADGLDVDLDTVLEMNVQKLRKRYPDGFSAERSTNRSES